MDKKIFNVIDKIIDGLKWLGLENEGLMKYFGYGQYIQINLIQI